MSDRLTDAHARKLYAGEGGAGSGVLAVPVYKAHCYWWPACQHTASSGDPDDLHDLMEHHYAADHPNRGDRQ